MKPPILTAPVISKLPLGLLGFFGIKNGGKYPQTLGETIVPTLEQINVLAENYHTKHAYIAAPNAPGWHQATVAIAGVPQRVPENEIWLIRGASMHHATGAGEAINATAAVRGDQWGAAAASYHVISQPFTLAASTNILLPCSEPDFWAGPGDEFGFWVNTVTFVGPLLTVLEFKITRFPF